MTSDPTPAGISQQNSLFGIVQQVFKKSISLCGPDGKTTNIRFRSTVNKRTIYFKNIFNKYFQFDSQPGGYIRVTGVVVGPRTVQSESFTFEQTPEQSTISEYGN